MSNLSSRPFVDEEDSCCESESDVIPSENGKTKNRTKRKVLRKLQAQRDDETESQINYEETFDSSPMSIQTQDKMRRRLQFFFMNPVEKWQAKRR